MTHTFPSHWAALPDVVSELYAQRRSPPATFAAPADRARALDSLRDPRVVEGVAMIAIRGPLTKYARYSPLGMMDYEAAIRAAADRPDVNSLLLVIESPGGTVDGTPRLAGVVAQVAKRKPVVAYADGLMASAAYWIGSQASAIVASPFAIVGSIGTLLVHTDFSVMLDRAGIKVTMLTAPASTQKTEGNPYESLSKDFVARMKSELGRANDAFISGVRSRRPGLGADAFTGAAWMAESAPRGLIDRIGEIESAIFTALQLAVQAGTYGVGRPPAPAAALATRAPESQRAAEAFVRHRELFAMRPRGGM